MSQQPPGQPEPPRGAAPPGIPTPPYHQYKGGSPPPPQTLSSRWRRYSWWAKLLLGFIAVAILIVVIGFLSPVLILAALAFLLLAWRKPDSIARVMGNQAVATMPRWLHATPVRFATILAAVIIPVSALAGFYVYEGAPGQEQKTATATAKQSTRDARTASSAITATAKQGIQDTRTANSAITATAKQSTKVASNDATATFQRSSQDAKSTGTAVTAASKQSTQDTKNTATAEAATAKQSTQDTKSTANAASTAVQQDALAQRAAQTANAPTSTPKPTVTPKPPTSTPMPPTPTLSPDQDRATYPAVDVRELNKNPDKFKGQKVKLEGEIFKIQEKGSVTTFQMWVTYPGASEFDRIPIAVVFEGNTPGYYEGAQVTVYGTGAGTFSGTNAFGAKITQPIIDAQHLGG